jgi:hypothetical protein
MYGSAEISGWKPEGHGTLWPGRSVPFLVNDEKISIREALSHIFKMGGRGSSSVTARGNVTRKHVNAERMGENATANATQWTEAV